MCAKKLYYKYCIQTCIMCLIQPIVMRKRLRQSCLLKKSMCGKILHLDNIMSKFQEKKSMSKSNVLMMKYERIKGTTKVFFLCIYHTFRFWGRFEARNINAQKKTCFKKCTLKNQVY